MRDLSSETMVERLCRLLSVYSIRTGEKKQQAAFKEQAESMADGLASYGVSTSDLCDLMELATEYKAIPDYRACLRVIRGAEWSKRGIRVYEAEKARNASAEKAALDAIYHRPPADPLDELIEARLAGLYVSAAPKIGEVWRYWQTLLSCPPSVRRGVLSGRQATPYGPSSEVWSRLEAAGKNPLWEQWDYLEPTGWMLNNRPAPDIDRM